MKTSKLWVLVAVLAGGVAAAADTVEDRKAVMDAQIDLLKKQAELNKLLREVAGSSAMGMPVVISISQIGAEHVARLQMANGNTSYFREGDVVQPGVMLSGIGARQVFVRVGAGKKATAVPLEFARAVTGVPGQANSGQPVSVPNDAFLPPPPNVTVPAIEVIPAAPQAATKPAGK
jgi:hypothetical protein